MDIDTILNWAIPALLILIVAGWLYTKLLLPWVVPHIVNAWNRMRDKQEEAQSTGKEIVYE